MKEVITTSPRVYCGTYAKYNNGSIAGAWVDLSKFEDVNGFYKHIKNLHKDEHDPEYMFQDFEGFPDSEYSECGMDFEKLIEYAQLDEDEREVVAAYVVATGYSFKDFELQDAIDKVVFKEDESDMNTLAVQYAEHWADSTGEVPEHLSWYIDWQKYGESLLENYSEGNGYVFADY